MVKWSAVFLLITLMSVYTFGNENDITQLNYLNNTLLPGQEGGEEEGEEEEEKTTSFSNVTIGTLFLMDFINMGFGFEIRAAVDSNRIKFPLEIYYLSKDIRMRTWPEIFLSERKKPGDSAVFVSIFTQAMVKSAQSDNSSAEVGLGAGFSADVFSIGIWISTSFYQGSPSVQDIFGFRSRAEITPGIFQFVIAFRMGTAILESTAGYTTSATTLDLEIDLGVSVWKTLTIVLGLEARTDNFGALLDSDASAAGIDEAMTVLLKVGVTYTF